MARKLICGFECGDGSEIAGMGSGNSIVSSVKRSGAYSHQNDATTTGESSFDLGANTIVQPRASLYLQVQANSGASQHITLFQAYDSVNHLGAFTVERIGTSFTVQAYNASFAAIGVASITALNIGQWYKFAVDFTPGAGTGAAEVYMDGTSVLSMTGQQYGAGPVRYIKFNISTAPGAGFAHWMDDYIVDDAVIPGASSVIARQVTPGTPTYDNWTKIG